MDNICFGVLKCIPGGSGFLRNPENSFRPHPDDPWVSNTLIRRAGLTDGAGIEGTMMRGHKGWQLETIRSVCGLDVEAFRSRVRFERLAAIDPRERIKLGSGGNVSMRIIELIAPIGKGTRGLIVAPPKSGKTQILEEMAVAVHQTEPECRIIVLLIDERPEEVTHFRRRVPAEVLASSSDQDLDSHINLAELALAHIRCELESGRDVIVLVDSITRLARAFNRQGKSSGRTLTGGLDSDRYRIEDG
jgi:transcription termination factor Rho